MKNVVLCVTGGIAAYKTVDLVSRLKKQGLNVDVLMTKSACEFVTPLTFESISGNRVVSDMFDREFTYDVEHISLAKKADLFAIIPATANIIGKIANGIADDMITTTAMATKAPLLLAPAMNTNMYENPVVQKNISKLENHGATFIEPESGRLACGDVGKGKLANIEEIEQAILSALTPKDLVGKRVLVTAGATREAIDPVRFITNHSTGKMGYEIARACVFRGAEVTLISGQTNIKKPENCKVIDVITAENMYNAVISEFETNDIIIKTAAVADFTPKISHNNKIKKANASNIIELDKTEDILKKIGEMKSNHQVLCGFSMETENLIENSVEKLNKKNLDMIVCNDLNEKGAGFSKDTNIVTIITKKNQKKLEIMSKFDVANRILDEILKLR